MSLPRIDQSNIKSLESDVHSKKRFLIARDINEHYAKDDDITSILQDMDDEFRLPSIHGSQKNIQKNIFKEPQALVAVQHDPNLGPRYVKNKIVPHSLVGKPEWFSRQINQYEGKSTRKIITMDEDSKSTSTMLHRNKRQTTKIVPISMKSINKNEKLINLNEVRDMISNIEIRLNQNKLREQSRSVPMYKKLNRDTKALQIYEDHENQWSDFIINTSMTLQRNPKDSQLLDVYRYRKRKEILDTNDTLKKECEKRNVKLWEVKIKDDHEQQESLKGHTVPILLCELQSVNQKGVKLEEPVLDNVAIVRKALIQRGERDESLNSSMVKSIIEQSDDRTLRSFTTQQYLEMRYKAYKDEAIKKHHLRRITVDPENLYVVGTSQLDFETQQIKKESFGFYKVMKPTSTVVGEELIESNYDFRNYHNRLD